MIKKIFCLLSFSIIFSMSAIGFSEQNLNDLEYAKYGTSYEHESLAQRLNRLETDFFGMSQTGDIEKRLNNLSKINSEYKNGISTPYSSYTTKPKGILRNFWDNLTSGFMNNDGYMTGYTPSIMNTSSSMGMPNDAYNNYLYNNMNNFPSYCPYNPRFQNNYHNRYANPNNRYFNGVNRFQPYSRYNRYYNRPYLNNSAYYNPRYRPNSNVTTYYLPPNVQTKSSVHILQD